MANKKKSSKVVKSDAEETATDEAIDVSEKDQKPDENAAEAEIVVETDPVIDGEEPTVVDENTDGDPVPEEAAAASDQEDAAPDQTAPEEASEDTSDAAAETAPIPVHAPEPVVIRQGGFVPMVLGGLVAAAIGFGLARFVLPEPGADPAIMADLERKIDDQTALLSDLTSRAEALELRSDVSGLEDGQSDNQAAIAALADRLSDVESRLTALASEPAGDATSGAALAAQQQELNDLRAAVDAMTEQSALLEENAQAAAQATLQRAALTRIMTALDAGVGFDAAIADLEGLGVTVPDALAQSAATGVASLTALQESFPEAARAALAMSRDAAGDAEGGGFTAFLRSQLGARSLEPREGRDPDAVLSRVEAAVREGRLADALAEVEALPEEGRAELADWAAQVANRRDAVSAAQDLSAKLN